MVSAWIGNEAADSHRAIEALVQITTLATNPESWPKGLPEVPGSWAGRKSPPQDDPVWADIDALFEREWFTRAWILQEVVFASKLDVYCGKWRIDGDDLFYALKICIKEHPRYLKDWFPK